MPRAWGPCGSHRRGLALDARWPSPSSITPAFRPYVKSLAAEPCHTLSNRSAVRRRTSQSSVFPFPAWVVSRPLGRRRRSLDEQTAPTQLGHSPALLLRLHVSLTSGPKSDEFDDMPDGTSDSRRQHRVSLTSAPNPPSLPHVPSESRSDNGVTWTKAQGRGATRPGPMGSPFSQARGPAPTAPGPAVALLPPPPTPLQPHLRALGFELGALAQLQDPSRGAAGHLRFLRATERATCPGAAPVHIRLHRPNPTCRRWSSDRRQLPVVLYPPASVTLQKVSVTVGRRRPSPHSRAVFERGKNGS